MKVLDHVLKTPNPVRVYEKDWWDGTLWLDGYLVGLSVNSEGNIGKVWLKLLDCRGAA